MQRYPLFRFVTKMLRLNIEWHEGFKILTPAVGKNV